MTIALPGSSKLGLSGLLGRKRSNGRSEEDNTKKLQKTIKRDQIATLFDQQKQESVKNAKPAKLNDNEKQDRDRLSSLRGALYSTD